MKKEDISNQSTDSLIELLQAITNEINDRGFAIVDGYLIPD